ncbi:MAG: hypothetical protein NT166_11915 [Candidatus Aminicenantes bacterium]|nr:hypothetical protein [Candidatus Aminicenantes bacterium]
MKMKVFLIIICAISLMQFICSSGEPDKNINLPVPYHQQVFSNYCGIACIQMWAEYNGICVSQQEIAAYLGIGCEFVSPYLLDQGVANFTGSQGYLAIGSIFDPDAQGNLIGATISGIKEYIPAIMPFNGNHAVLIKGYKWHEDANGRPIADKAYYHDPDDLPNQIITAGELESTFVARPSYWVIVGYPSLVPEGREGYNVFILEGGTYYGGSSNRDPQQPPQ